MHSGTKCVVSAEMKFSGRADVKIQFHYFEFVLSKRILGLLIIKLWKFDQTVRPEQKLEGEIRTTHSGKYEICNMCICLDFYVRIENFIFDRCVVC